MAESPLDPVAVDGRTDRPAHHEPDRRGPELRPGGDDNVCDEGGPGGLGATPDGEAEVLAAAHAMDLVEQRAQADSLGRPLRRRDDRIERPARVRMRSRKPCFLARRRLFGWYVRWLTGLPHVGRWRLVRGSCWLCLGSADGAWPAGRRPPLAHRI